MKIYLVGGAVRDELMGRPIKERDYVVVEGSIKDMLAKGFVSVGKDFPVFLHPETKEEYALARTERKVSGGYHGFEFDTSSHITLEEDLKRRDLTINAMAKTETGEIIDPYGGQQDLQKKILRHVSDAFLEDPVRVLRVARFAARFHKDGFTVAPETLSLMKKMVSEGECDYLVPERIWKELTRALEESSPEVFFSVLEQCHALIKILPEISHLSSANARLMKIVMQSPDPKIRFAAFLQDLNEESLKVLSRRLKCPNDYHDLALNVIKYHKFYAELKQKNADEILQLLERLDAFRRSVRLFDFMTACMIPDEAPSQLLNKAFEAAGKVQIDKIIGSLQQNKLMKPMYAGENIRNAIREARRLAIEDILPKNFFKGSY